MAEMVVTVGNNEIIVCAIGDAGMVHMDKDGLELTQYIRHIVEGPVRITSNMVFPINYKSIIRWKR